MKKIAFISAGYLPLPSVKGGAVETLTDILLESEKLSKNYKIDVYSIFDKSAKEISKKNKNVNYYYIDTSKKVLCKCTRYIINKYSKRYIGNDFINLLVKKYKGKLKEYDCIIIENKPEYGLYLKQYINGKLIFHSHNDFLNKNIKHSKEMFDCYDKIFCLSKYIYQHIIEINPLKKEKVKLLYNGIDIDKFNIKIDKKIEREKYHLKLNDKVFLYTGRLVPEKGVLEMLEAFNKVNDDKFKLLIVGSIGYGKTTKNKFTKKLIKLSEKNKNIIFTGYINYEDIPKLYNLSDYGIVPSIWEEPFALTVIEHLASGHPVIISNSGAMPELVNDKCSVIFNKDNNAVENLYNCIISITHIKYNKDDCKKQSNKFNSELYVETFIKLIRDVLKEEDHEY